VELLGGEYVLTTLMLTDKDIFSNWTKCRMCGIIVQWVNEYVMPLLEEIFDAFSHTKVFNTLNLRSSYHQLPLRESDKAQTSFWGINIHGKDWLYWWRFLPFGSKNALLEFQRVMDQVSVGLSFTKCYIDDIIVFSLTLTNHMHHL
jgi:hypothetical protein